jgi:imidazolonepropionase-like amidohydrolase
MLRLVSLTVLCLGMTVSLCLSALPAANPDTTPHTVLFKGVKVFDGKSDTLSAETAVLVVGNKIEKIGGGIKVSENAPVIDAKGRTLMPGFIDAHAHIMFQLSVGDAMRTDEFYHALVGAQMAEVYLMRGYTTIRDVSGNTFSLKMAIDRGITVGPRIYPSGPMISQSSGHSDHRPPNEPSRLQGGQWSTFNKYGHTLVVDGVPEVLRGVRDTLRRGASQIKIAVGGGTGSEFDPLDVVEFTDEEIRAATQAASDWNTYVTAHVYNPNGIRRAIDNGVKCIEHANLIDEKTLRYMMDKDIWLSPQVIVYTYHPRGYSEDQKKKHDQAFAGIATMFTTAKKIGFKKIAFGSDIITDPEMLMRINEEFVQRSRWFKPAEILRQATGNNGELMAMSGKRNPYPGKLGIIEEGALADILLIDGDPLVDIERLTKPEKNLVVIMKDGRIYKNLINGQVDPLMRKRVEGIVGPLK